MNMIQQSTCEKGTRIITAHIEPDGSIILIRK